jgi:hypothetical protein
MTEKQRLNIWCGVKNVLRSIFWAPQGWQILILSVSGLVADIRRWILDEEEPDTDA